MNEDRFRRQAKNRLLMLLVVLSAVAIAFWYFSRPAGHARIASIESAAGNAVAKEVQKNVSNPTPLIATGTKPSAPVPGRNADTLTRTGIITETNLQRAENGGLAAFSESALLNRIASERLNDMVVNQYFAHVSPTGSSAEMVAQADGYSYIALGENLALGNFPGDTGVVAAWMASPGHRANILNTHYTEIGVAAEQAVYQGEETWFAVQVFGRPASDCPAPDPAMKSSIDSVDTKIASMASELSAQESTLNTMSPPDPAYNGAVASYNALATTYNSLLAATKADINTYDAAVEAYNACLGD